MYEDMFKYNVFAMIYSRNLPVNEGHPIPFRNIVEGLYSITLLQFEKKKQSHFTPLSVCITVERFINVSSTSPLHCLSEIIKGFLVACGLHIEQ